MREVGSWGWRRGCLLCEGSWVGEGDGEDEGGLGLGASQKRERSGAGQHPPQTSSRCVCTGDGLSTYFCFRRSLDDCPL